MKLKHVDLVVILIVCLAAGQSVECISRWFSSSYHDLRVALKRYSHCISGLSPLRDNNVDETEYLINSMRYFLEQANLENEQLVNVSALMTGICSEVGVSQDGLPTYSSMYSVSTHINVSIYENKQVRCRAIDEAMDAMYPVFRRAALNKSEPLDFSTILWYPNATNKEATYNLLDLINTAWINSETVIEHVCSITNPIKEYVKTHNSVAQDRSGGNQRRLSYGLLDPVFNLIDRILDPILGLQRRFYWESTNRLEQGYLRVGNGLSSIRDGLGRGVKGARNRVVALFNSTSSAVPANSTISKVVTTNLTSAQPVASSTTKASVVAVSTTVRPLPKRRGENDDEVRLQSLNPAESGKDGDKISPDI